MKFVKSFISFLALFLLFGWNLAFAQNAYIQTDVLKIAGVTASQINTLPIASKSTTYVYLNGLGTPVQKVGYKQSPNSNDVIQIYQYDQYGQRATGYLPYVDDNTQHAQGSYRATALTDQQNYYINNNTPGNMNKVANDPFPFSQELFENSPLHRLMAVGSAGLGFQPDLQDNSQHYSVISYRNNTTADNVMVAPASGVVTYYPANALSVADGKDADGANGAERLLFTNSSGQVVLKRQVSGQTSEPFYDTYYVYNANGSVAYVIPPKAAHLIAIGAATNIKAAPLYNLIYAYGYDLTFGRIITRKAPNTGTVSIIYDPMNRPVLVQDGNQAVTGVNQWNYIKYDGQNRAISTGVYTDNVNFGQAAMQNYVNTNYGANFYESRSSSQANGYYTNSCFPSQNLQPLGYSFYDDYNLIPDGSPNYSYQPQGLVNSVGVSIEAAPVAVTQGMLTMSLTRSVGSGLATIWLTKVYFYDKHNNVIQQQSNNHLNFTPYVVTDCRTLAPDFLGKPLQTKVSKVTKVTGSGSATTNTVLTTVNYDSNNVRIQSISQVYNSQAPVTIANYEYNETGQLVTKQLGYNTTKAAYLQTLDYRYNIRGQLLTVNNSTLSNDNGVTNSDNTDLFGMTYLYDGTDSNLANAKPSYTGRISVVKWSYKYNNGANTSNERSYVYQYDKLGQLNSAMYAERAPSGSPTSPPSTSPFNVNMDGFDESGIAYDDDGNITALKRNYSSNNGTGGTPLDNLVYNYSTNSNGTNNNPDQLQQVSDAVTTISAYGFNNVAVAPSTSSYVYDANGNLKSDPYKNISITYNLINKTDVIIAAGISSSTISYTYSSENTVLKKQVATNGTVQTTDYIDEFIYTNGVVSSFTMPEGRVVYTGATFKPEYIITDQQGNARFSFQDNGAGAPVIIQENSYYAFGAVMPNSLVPSSSATNNNNLYDGGSEWQNAFQNLPDYYQTGARNYDPELGRFISVDPMAELSISLTNYHYAGNNPMMMNDPSGNDDVSYQNSESPQDYGSGGDNTTEDGGGSGGYYPTYYYNNTVPGTTTSYGGAYNRAPTVPTTTQNDSSPSYGGDSGPGSGSDPVPVLSSVIQSSTIDWNAVAQSLGIATDNNLQVDENDNNEIWPFSDKSDPASWVFRTAIRNENVQTAGVSGIELTRHDIRYNLRQDELTVIAIDIKLPTLYFEYPKITNMFFKKNEKLSSTFAALVMARATDRAIKQTRDWIDKQDNPTEWGTNIEFMKNLIEQVLKDGGRVTPIPNYLPVIVTPYKTL